MSRIGKKPIIIPKDVKAAINDRLVTVEGPKGKLDYKLSARVNGAIKENQIILQRVSNIKQDKALHGLARALIANMIKGVTEGYVRELEIIGTGFRAQIQGDSLNLQLSYSHPVNFSIPPGIKIETPKPTQIVVRGIDKEKVGEVASQIRAIFPPEPYKGKGIRYAGEHVRKKIGKAQAATK